MMAIKNLQQFNRRMRQIGKTLPPELVIPFQKKMVLTVLQGAVMKTPVVLGRARGNWQVEIGSMPSGELDTFDKTGSATINEGLSKLVGLTGFAIVWIANNLVYAPVLEYGDDKRKPVGMLSRTLGELGAI